MQEVNAAAWPGRGASNPERSANGGPESPEVRGAAATNPSAPTKTATPMPDSQRKKTVPHASGSKVTATPAAMPSTMERVPFASAASSRIASVTDSAPYHAIPGTRPANGLRRSMAQAKGTATAR